MSKTADSGYQAEQAFATTSFGVVTNKLVIYQRPNWFGGDLRKDIPLKYVTAVRLEFSRRILHGSLLLLIGLALLASVSVVTMLYGMALIFWAMLLVWGFLNVVDLGERFAPGPTERRGSRPQAEAVVERFASSCSVNSSHVDT